MFVLLSSFFLYTESDAKLKYKKKHKFSTDFRVKRGPHIKLETGKETLNKLTQHKSLTNPEEMHPKNDKGFKQHRRNIIEPYFL